MSTLLLLMDLQLRFWVTEMTWRDISDVFGFQVAVNVISVTQNLSCKSMSNNTPCTLLAELVIAFSSLYCCPQAISGQMASGCGVIVRYSLKCSSDLYSWHHKSAYTFFAFLRP